MKISNLKFKIETEIRECPSCGMKTIKGMPGGREAVCKNCGYKDPCCTD